MTNEMIDDNSLPKQGEKREPEESCQPEEILPYTPDPEAGVRTLKEMLLAILLWGAIWQVAGVWFVKEKMQCSLGLWLGVILAMAAAIHMYWALDKALDMGEAGAPKVMTQHSIIRYTVIVLVLGTVMITEVVNPLTAFLGLMGLKTAAYAQPFIHNMRRRR